MTRHTHRTHAQMDQAPASRRLRQGMLVSAAMAFFILIGSPRADAQWGNQEFLGAMQRMRQGTQNHLALTEQCAQGSQRACADSAQRLQALKRTTQWMALWDNTIGWRQRQSVRMREQEVRHWGEIEAIQASGASWRSARQYESAARAAAASGDYQTARHYAAIAHAYDRQAQRYAPAR